MLVQTSKATAADAIHFPLRERCSRWPRVMEKGLCRNANLSSANCAHRRDTDRLRNLRKRAAVAHQEHRRALRCAEKPRAKTCLRIREVGASAGEDAGSAERLAP